MSQYVHVLSYSLLFPPMLFISIALLAACAGLKWPRTGLAIVIASLLALCAFATPFASDRIMAVLEREVPHAPSAIAPGAILVFGADMQTLGESDAGDTLGYLSLERVLMAAHESRQRNLPILVSGGVVTAGHPPIADLMAATLENDLHVDVRWREDKSRNTLENAQFSAAILHDAEISTVVLVAQRWDIPRASWALKQFGIDAIPSGQARLLTPSTAEVTDFIPTVSGLNESFIALHELLGLRYYRLDHSGG